MDEIRVGTVLRWKSICYKVIKILSSTQDFQLLQIGTSNIIGVDRETINKGIEDGTWHLDK
jgi:hypothetical protein